MVQRECSLEPFGGLLSGGEERPGIVRQDIDVLVACAHLLREGSNVHHERQVSDVLVHRRTAPGCSRFARHRLDPLRLATHERNLRALVGELDSSGSTDATSGTG